MANYIEKYNTILNKLYDHHLTKKLYNDPVMADDGEIYEKIALIKHLRQNNYSSPKYPDMTITTNFIKTNLISSLVTLFVEHNPALKDEMYVVEEDIDFLDYDKFNIILGDNNKFNEILKYKHIDLYSLNIKSLEKFIANKTCIAVQKYFVDNVIDIDSLLQFGPSPNYLINIAISNKNFELVKYLIDKVNINCIEPNDGNTPLHLLIRTNAPTELISQLINNGADLSIRDSKGYSSLDYIMRFCEKDVLDCVLHHCVDSDGESKNKQIGLLYDNQKINDEDKEIYIAQMF